jgi:hypothetical protein
MSRDRPTELPRVLPDAELRVKRETPRQREAREDLERLKATKGPGFFGALVARFGPDRPNVRFIRAGYEAGIVDDLKDFYARRPRPWRPENCSSCKPTHKERLKAQRRSANAR